MSTLLNNFRPTTTTASKKVLPVILCLDISQSMNTIVDMNGAVKTGEGLSESGKKITFYRGAISRFDKMKEAIRELYNTLEETPQAEVEIAIVTFNDQVNVVENFVPFHQSQGLNLLPTSGSGQTLLGEAALASFDLIDQANQRYDEDEQTRFIPWFLVFSDGENRGNPQKMEEAISKANHLEKSKRLMTYCFGINDDDFNLETLKRLNNGYEIHPFKAINLPEIFKMITYTMQQTAAGNVTNPKYQLDENMQRLIREGRI